MKREKRYFKLILASVVLSLYETTVANLTLETHIPHLWQNLRDNIFGILKPFLFFLDEDTDSLNVHRVFGKRDDDILLVYVFLA